MTFYKHVLKSDQQAEGLEVFVKAKPNARQSRILGVSKEEDCLLLALRAVPLEGAANRELVEFLALAFGLKKWAVTLLKGNNSRHKRVFFSGLEESKFKIRLEELLKLNSENSDLPR